MTTKVRHACQNAIAWSVLVSEDIKRAYRERKRMRELQAAMRTAA